MLTDHFPYRVRFDGDSKDVCFIEADAPVDIEKMRRFITKTRRVFGLADDADIRVIELRQVTERHEITKDILIKEIGEAYANRMDVIRRTLEAHERGEISPMDSYRATRDLFGWDDVEPVSDDDKKAC